MTSAEPKPKRAKAPPIVLSLGWWRPADRKRRTDHNRSVHKPRQVFALSNERVLYGDGGDGPKRECKQSTFRNWVKRMKAAPAEGQSHVQ